MVSTTLTAIAAGQPTTSSNTNYHHHHQSSNATAVVASSTTANSNSNYPKPHSILQQQQQQQQQQQHQQQQRPHSQLQHHSSSSSFAVIETTSTSTPTTTPTPTATTSARNSYYNYNAYTTTTLKSNNNDKFHTSKSFPPTNANPCGEDTEEADRNLSLQYQQRPPPSALRYDRENHIGKVEETIGESEPTTANPTQRNEIVTLSQALLTNSSSPLNDQISLLFPKCRPKHATSNGNATINNTKSNTNSNSSSETAGTANLNIESYESGEVLNGVAAVASPTQSQSHSRTSRQTDPFRSPSIKAQVTTRNYYRNVNIITQSPPPPSTSSVSSESLSSVTPRISTNPFLCPTDDNNDDTTTTSNQLTEHEYEHENSFQEDLPVPTYRTFYYHTSIGQSGSNNGPIDNYRGRSQQFTPPQEHDDNNGREMPRKRNSYYSNSIHSAQSSAQSHTAYAAHASQIPSMMAADNQRHQQLRQQQQPHSQQQQQQVHQQSNGTQNPFIRDNYWETPTTHHNNIAASNVVLSSTDDEPPPSYQYAMMSASLRRAYHHQMYSNNSGNENSTGRGQQQQQQQQQARMARSPIKVNESLPTAFNESSKTTDHHHRTDQTPTQVQIQKSSSDGQMPQGNTTYTHGGGKANGNTTTSSGGTVVGSSSSQNIMKDRPREQDVRDKRDVGQLQQLTQRQQHNSQTAMTKEGRFSMISNGEVVVFDDINESWQNLKVTTDTNAPRLSPITQNGIMSTSSSKVIQQNTMTVMDVISEGNAKSNLKIDEITNISREHKKHTEKPVIIDARHAIIEYEGSPRRIGHSGNSPDEDRMTSSAIQAQNASRTTATNYNNASNNSFNTNSPQQYPARPGFPQRIMSPPRESTPAAAAAAASIPSYMNNTKGQFHHYKAEQQAAQPQMMLPIQQQSPTDNNTAEDTSNDVSEIGTISDLTTPDIMSTGLISSSQDQESTQTFGATTPTGQVSTTTAATAQQVTTTTTPNTGTSALTIPTKSTSTFDYLYEFSETRKVLEEFFKCPSNDDKPIEDSSDIDSVDIQYEFHSNFDRDDDDPVDAEEEDDDDDDDDDDEDEQPEPEANHAGDDDGDGDDDDDDEDDDLPLQNQKTQQQNLYFHQQQTHQQQQQQQQSVQELPATQTLPRYQYHNQQQLMQRQQEQQEQQNEPKLTQESSQNQYVNHRRRFTGSPLMRDFDFFLDSASRSSGEQNDQQQDGINHNQHVQDGRNNYRYSPETTDYDSNCGDLDSLSGDMNGGGVSTSCSNYAKFYASSMPVLEDGLSSGHTSDTENNNNNNNKCGNVLEEQPQYTGIHHTAIGGGISVLMDMKRVSTNNSINSINNTAASSTTTEAIVSVSEKYNSVSPNIFNDGGGHQRKLESPISSPGMGMGMGILDDQLRETGRSMMNRDNHHIRNNQDRELLGQSPTNIGSSNKVFKNIDPDLDALYSINVFHRTDMVQMTPPPPAPAPHRKPEPDALTQVSGVTFSEIRSGTTTSTSPTPTTSIASAISSTLNRNRNPIQNNSLPIATMQQLSHLHNNSRASSYQTQQVPPAPPPPPIPERALQRSPSPVLNSPVWLPRHCDNSANKNLIETSTSNSNHSKNHSADEDDIDTDLETDRLLGHQRLDDQGYYDENKSWERNKSRSLLSKISPKQQQSASTKTRNGYNALLSSTPEIPPPIPPKNSANKFLDISGSMSSPEHSDKSPMKTLEVQENSGTVNLTSPGGSNGSARISSGNAKKDVEIERERVSNNGHSNTNGSNGSSTSGNESINNISGSNHAGGEKKVKKSKNKEGGAVLIEGVLFRAKYLGSTQLVCEGQPTKSTRMMQAEEAVSRIKAPDSDVQPSTEVDLFISTEKIMVLNTDLKEIMMDHALRTISYIADIGDLVVLMARRRFVPQDIDDAPKPNRTPKMICHVFESDEAQFIAQSIGQAFQVAYMEFLKANGIEDHSFVKEMDYQEVLNSQEIFGDELEIFAKKELQKEVVVPKAKGEILGVVIVESGWGSMLPTVVIANLMSSGAAARCGQLNIGDQLIAINGLSLVGLPLSTCQNYIKNTKNQTVVKFTVVPCPPVVEVKIKRPNTKYQLGFSVQNGVICSLLRGGIAERGGVRVGHRIIEINNQSVVAVPHEKIVNLLATSVGEILMKTMPTSMFRLLTGQETPIYI